MIKVELCLESFRFLYSYNDIQTYVLRSLLFMIGDIRGFRVCCDETMSYNKIILS